MPLQRLAEDGSTAGFSAICDADGEVTGEVVPMKCLRGSLNTLELADWGAKLLVFARRERFGVSGMGEDTRTSVSDSPRTFARASCCFLHIMTAYADSGSGRLCAG